MSSVRLLLTLSFVASLATACGGGGKTCAPDDLDCFLDDLDVLTVGGRLAELAPVAAADLPQPGAAGAPTFDGQPPSIVFDGVTNPRVALPWTNPGGGRPAHCLRLCAGGTCTDARCDRSQPGPETTGMIDVFLLLDAEPVGGLASFEIEMTPLATADGTEAIATLDAGGVVLAGAPVIVPAQVYRPGPPGTGCPSDYDGLYIGMLAYEYATTAAPDPLVTMTADVQLQITLECLASSSGSTALSITHAMAGDPAFGCQLGCAPMFGSAALLPQEAPTTPSNQSKLGEGFSVTFPNGATIITANTVGAMNVTTGGRILSNSLDPAIADRTWSAVLGDGSCFPVDAGGSCTLPNSGFTTRYFSWAMTKSAL